MLELLFVVGAGLVMGALLIWGFRTLPGETLADYCCNTHRQG